MKQLILAIAISALSIHAYADGEYEKMAMEFAKCNGVYEANADFIKTLGKPAAVEKFMGQARGAKLVSAYLFSKMKVHHGKAYGKLFPMVEAYAYEYKSHVDFIFENGKKEDVGNIMDMLDICVTLNPLQTEIVQMIRKDAYATN